MKELSIEEKYREALERAKAFKEHLLEINDKGYADEMDYIFPELKESEDEKISKILVEFFKSYKEQGTIGYETFNGIPTDKILAWLEKQGKEKKITHEEICKSYGISDIAEFSDGYHTFNELYYYRMLYNAAFFNLLPKEWVHKSKRHHDGEECFGGGWFIVMANLPTGQISNHYELKDWDLFKIPEKEVADEWDGHTPQEAADRLYTYSLYFLSDNVTCKEHDDSLTRDDEERIKNILSVLDAQVCWDGYHKKKGNPYQKEIDWLKSLKIEYNHNLRYTITSEWEPADKIKPKFDVDDWIVCNETLVKIVDCDNNRYTVETTEGLRRPALIGTVDRKFHLWTIADAKDGDVLVTDDMIVLFEKRLENDSILTYFHYDTIDNEYEPGCHLYYARIYPATKEQRDLLFQKMKESGYEWDEKRLELKKKRGLNNDTARIQFSKA